MSSAPLAKGGYGASHDDGETVHAGKTRADAIAAAEDDWREKVDCGDDDEPTYPHQLELELYTELEWCVGPTEEHEDCFCGLSHRDYGNGRDEPRLLQGWGDCVKVTHEVTA